MKIDHSKLTPEIIQEMREVIRIGGADPDALTDEEVIAAIERLVEAMIGLGRQIHEAVVKPMVTFVEEFAHSPTMHALREMYEQDLETRHI